MKFLIFLLRFEVRSELCLDEGKLIVQSSIAKTDKDP